MSTETKRKQKHREPKAQPAPVGAERLKTVVRRLPPNLPEPVFWQSVQAWVTDDTVNWRSYYPGKFRTKRTNKEGVPSRAYIAFKNEELVARFSREYDGHVFRDKAGNESQAIVEFAPFQKTPTDKKKSDARNNTIDKDEDYISFLDSLKGKTESVTLEALVAASQSPPAPTTTPLLEALKAEKLAQKDKETILRSHAHYKDAGASKKEEVAKKAARVQAQAKVGETPAVSPPMPVSKKARKAAAAAAAASAPKAPDAGKPPVSSPPTSPPSAPPVAGRGRHRAKDRPTPSSKGDPPVPPPSAAPVSAPVTADPTAGQRKRPVIGLGRQLEAALSGAGVAVSSSGPAANPGPAPDRRKHDKSRDASGASKRREDSVPSILQRPEGEVAIMQRATSPKVAPGAGAGDGSTGTGGGTGPVPTSRGPKRERGKRRGRGGLTTG